MSHQLSLASPHQDLCQPPWPSPWVKAVSLTFSSLFARAQEVLWAQKVLQKNRSISQCWCGSLEDNGVRCLEDRAVCLAWHRSTSGSRMECRGKLRSIGEGLAFSLKQEWVSKAAWSAWFISSSANVDEHGQLGMIGSNTRLLKA